MDKNGSMADVEFSNRLHTAVNMIRSLYNVTVTELRTRPQADAFCQRHCLHRIQMYLDEKTLSIARDTLDDETLFVIGDVFMLEFALFSIRGVPYAIGPFCRERLTPAAAENLIRQYQLDGLDTDQLLTYTASYPYIEERTAKHIVSALIQSVHPEEPHKELNRITSHAEALRTEWDEISLRVNHNTLIERRYAAEREMVAMIIRGDERSAVHQLHIMEQDVEYIKRADASLERERTGAAIARTTIRHAAIQAGLPALVIDRITTENAAEVQNAHSREAVLMSKEVLIGRVCRAIRTMRENQYSALVQNTMYYLEHEYRQEISIDRLAAEFGVSADHLISSFKKQTGTTPNAYLLRVRMKKAADLLATGSMIISDVSAEVGVSDPNYFVKLFRKEYGETPSAFRKRYTV